MKDKSLRVLIVENSEDDALLIIHNLKKGGYNPVHERVETPVAMKKALKEKQWDIILCDYSLPQFNAPSAIAVLKETNIDIPIIIVSGTVGENAAVECMRLGAQDYIMKGNLSRLCPVITRELEDTKFKNKQNDMEKRLRFEEQRFRALVEHSLDIIVIMNQEGIVQYINSAIERALGYKVEERIGANVLEVIHPDDLEYLANKVATLFTDANAPVVQFEMRLHHKDGSWRTFEAVGSNLVRDNVVESVIVNYRDITERKQAVDKLRREEQRFRALAEQSSDIIVFVNREGIVTYENPAMEKLLGFKPEERIGVNVFDRIHPDDFKVASDTFNTFTADTSSKDINSPVRQIRLRHKDGSWRIFETIASRFIHDNIVEAVMINVRDITERKRSDEMLRKSEEKYRTILETIEDGYYEVDIKGNFTFYNNSMCRILGYPPEEMMGMNNRRFTDKENQKKLFKTFNQVYTTGESAKEFDWQIIRKDGTKRFIEVSVSLQKNSSGQPIGFQGVARDVTERKQVADALRESEALYQLLAEHMTDIVWIMDMNLNVTWLSPSASKARGYSVEEIKALPLDRQLAPDSLRKAFNWLGKLMSLEKKGLITEPDGIFSRELEFYCKDGHVILLDCTFQFLRDERGKATSILAEGMDVTARKRAEEELKLTLDSLRKAFGTTIQIMVSAVEARDPYTAGHQLRSADLARSIAMELGLDQERIEGIRLAGSIHDIGKLSIPAEILSKPSKLTNIEFALVKQHPRSGYEMLKSIESPWPLAEIVYQHHERIDGSGYPRNLKGDNIILDARIMGVADVVEAMASHRPYRAALGVEIALEEIEKNKGILYDNDVAAACLRLFRKKGYLLVPKKS